MTYSNADTGLTGENISAKYLIQCGYTILQRNFRCRLGEIDIIAKHGTYICFVEVKTRRGSSFGSPCEAVDYFKQKRISRIAEFYVMKNNLFKYFFRFDVIEVRICSDKNYSINHIKDAFQA